MEKLAFVDMHTGGEPLRIIDGNLLPIQGETLMDKRRYMKLHLDHWRKRLMFEPRGHFDMYGAILVKPDNLDADIGVLFMHNEGYSTMCGHAIIALGRYCVDQGLVATQSPITKINIQCPCGLIETFVEIEDGKAGRVSFKSVPSFLFAQNLVANVPHYGEIRYDIAYGGAFYAVVEADQFGLKLGASPVNDFIACAQALCLQANQAITLCHDDHDDLAFLYGAIICDGHDGAGGEPSQNICVFADNQVDRSPTGSGVSARMAQMHHKGEVGIGEPRLFSSIVNSQFEARVESEFHKNDKRYAIVNVTGHAFYSAQGTMVFEKGDDLGSGFLLK